eukprot:3885251-Prymnesium_polylepis.2
MACALRSTCTSGCVMPQTGAPHATPVENAASGIEPRVRSAGCRLDIYSRPIRIQVLLTKMAPR